MKIFQCTNFSAFKNEQIDKVISGWGTLRWIESSRQETILWHFGPQRRCHWLTLLQTGVGMRYKWVNFEVNETYDWNKWCAICTTFWANCSLIIISHGSEWERVVVFGCSLVISESFRELGLVLAKLTCMPRVKALLQLLFKAIQHILKSNLKKNSSKLNKSLRQIYAKLQKIKQRSMHSAWIPGSQVSFLVKRLAKHSC